MFFTFRTRLLGSDEIAAHNSLQGFNLEEVIKYELIWLKGKPDPIIMVALNAATSKQTHSETTQDTNLKGGKKASQSRTGGREVSYLDTIEISQFEDVTAFLQAVHAPQDILDYAWKPEPVEPEVPTGSEVPVTPEVLAKPEVS